MPSSDARRDFISSACGNFFGIENPSWEKSEETAISIFLDDAHCPVLAASLSTASKLIFSNRFEDSKHENNLRLVFYKETPSPVTAENIKSNIYVSSISKSPAATLYHTLHNVFVPSLLKNENPQLEIDGKLEGLIKELETGLANHLRRHGAELSNVDSGEGDENSFGAIFVPEDEFKFWADVSASKPSSGKRAGYFLKILQRGQ